MSAVSGLPSVPASALPADVRQASPADQQTYRAALGFERMLVERLTRGMAESTASGQDDDATGAAGAYRDMLPGAMADSVTAAGGLGLGRQLFDAMRGPRA